MRSRIARVVYAIAHGLVAPAIGRRRLRLVSTRERAPAFLRWKAHALSAVSKRIAYVVQDTDRRHARAYDVFFALRKESRVDRRMAGRFRNGLRKAR
jgi:hypothetical protein